MSFKEDVDQRISEISDRWAEQDCRNPNERKTSRIIFDTIHGAICIEDYLVDLLDRPPMQRLRWIKQLGTSEMLYPTGSHSRFEHSLGTYSIAKQMLSSLKRMNAFNAKKDEEKNVLAAALLHDIGHICFSHTGELFLRYCSRMGDLIDGLREKVSIHEYIGYKIMDCSYMKEVITFINHQYGTGLDKDKIRAMIIGKYTNCERQFLADIVHGPIDADRTDYLLRDAYNVGFPHMVDVQRLLNTLTIVKVEEEEGLFWRLGIEEKGWRAVKSLFLARNRLRPTLYEHHFSRVSEEILIRILKESVRDPVSIIGLDDYDLFCKLRSSKEGAKSLEDYKNRKFYKRFLFFECLDESKRDHIGATFEERIEIEEEISRELWNDKSCCIMVVPKIEEEPNIGEVLIKPRKGPPEKAIIRLEEEIERADGLVSVRGRYPVRFFAPWDKICRLNSSQKQKVKEILSKKYNIRTDRFREVYCPKEYKEYSIRNIGEL